MADKPGKYKDPTLFIISGTLLICASQALEGVTAPIGAFLRGICLSAAILSLTWASYLYNTTPKT
jgi:hypothetical protein